jgi:hypothetical protein
MSAPVARERGGHATTAACATLATMGARIH